MTQLESTFYILGIIYMVLNIVLLVGIGIGIYYIVRQVLDIRRQVTEKIKIVENAIQHPEETAAKVGMSILKAGLRKAKKVFKQKDTN